MYHLDYYCSLSLAINTGCSLFDEKTMPTGFSGRISFKYTSCRLETQFHMLVAEWEGTSHANTNQRTQEKGFV
jgi:hypothetical protein